MKINEFLITNICVLAGVIQTNEENGLDSSSVTYERLLKRLNQIPRNDDTLRAMVHMAASTAGLIGQLSVKREALGEELACDLRSHFVKALYITLTNIAGRLEVLYGSNN